MNKWKQLLLAAGLVCCVGFAAKTDAQAANQVTGLKQDDDSSSMVSIQCDAVLGAECYYLELSTDGSEWTTVDTSSNPSLDAYSLGAGKTYYARVGLCSDWVGEEKIAGTESAPIQVVTAPNGKVEAVQSGAKTNGVQAKCSAVDGANFYQLYYDNVLIGQSSTSTVNSNVKMNAGTSYWCDLYACRKAPSGYIAVGDSGYGKFTTLSPAFNTKSFGVTSAIESINTFYFGVSTSYQIDGTHFQFATPAGKVVKNEYNTYTSKARIEDFILGNFYKYRVRSYVNCGTKKVYSGWSGYKYIGVPKKVAFKLSKNRKSLNLSISKVNNASSFTVYSSTKEKSGYKKVKTVSAKKRSVSVTKVGGKKIKRGKRYYFKIVPNAKIGGKTVASQNNVIYSYSYTYY